MKILSKAFFFSFYILAGCCFVASCNKADDVVYAGEGNIYMPTAARTEGYGLLLTDTAQSLPFGAAYGGLNYPSQDITVGFTIDSMLISSYNALHNTHYVMLPAASFSVPSLSGTIKAGETSTDALVIKVVTTNLDKSLKYVVPVTISSVTSGHIDSLLGVTYFRIDTIQRLEKDVTAAATISVSKDNGGGSGAGEGSLKLVDANYNSKFLTDGFPQAFWMQLTFPSSTILGAYTITSGNDAPERDMKNWNLSGSDDGTTWVVLDERTDETFSGRNVTKRYEFTNTTAYKQYRINVLANNGSNLIQVSEWRVINYP